MGHWVSNNWTNSDEYTASGTPFVTGSHGVVDLNNADLQIIEFPRVTRWIHIYNHNATAGHAMKVGFTENGLAGTPPHGFTEDEAHFIFIPGNKDTGRLELRCTKIFLKAATSDRVNFTVVAGLTNVPPRNFFQMTGSISGDEHVLGVG